MLKRYVLTKFVQCYLLSLLGLVGVFLVIDFFEQIDEFLAKGAPVTDMVAYFVYKIPHIIFFMAPQAVLLATVVALASLARNNEFTAMKACGIGVTGITLPIVLASAVISLSILASTEYIAPKTNKKMNYIFFAKVREKPTYGKIPRDNLWYKSKNGAIWEIDHYNPDQIKLTGVSIFLKNGTDRIQKRIDASEVVWMKNRWEFRNGFSRTFTKDGLGQTEYFDKQFFPVLETPSDFHKIRKRPEEMSLTEMYNSIQTRASEGKDVSELRVDLQYKISYPFVGIVLALLSIPLSLRLSRHGGVLFCVGVNLAMGLCFSFLYTLSISLGYGGTFSPLFAAWGPNVVFISLGFYFILTLDSETILPF